MKVHIRVSEINAPKGGLIPNSYQMWVSALPDSFGTLSNCSGKPLHCENIWTFNIKDPKNTNLEFLLKLWHLMKTTEPFAIAKFSLQYLPINTMTKEWIQMSLIKEGYIENVSILVEIHLNENSSAAFDAPLVIPLSNPTFPPMIFQYPQQNNNIPIENLIPNYPEVPIINDMIKNPYAEK